MEYYIYACAVVCSAPSVYLHLSFCTRRHVRQQISVSPGTDNEARMLWYTLIGGYMLTSMILFKYPTLLHKKKKVKFLCQHISHRGGESSLLLFLLFTIQIELILFINSLLRMNLFFFLGAGESYENTMYAFKRLVRVLFT